MLSVVEKVMFLQHVDVFSEVPTEELAFLAGIVEEKSFAKGEIIYGELDPSDSMYLVVSGKVRLHRDGKEVATAGENEAFGTWALFDDEPRLLSATALAETLTLRIDKEAFIDLLADNVQITRGVLKAIVGRLRRLLARFGGAESPPSRSS
jgi:formate hydrogenlyase transcriptional activator